MKKAILLLVALTATMVISACGGNGGTPTPTALTLDALYDDLGGLITSNGTISETTQNFVADFSAAMSTASMEAAGGIVMTCTGGRGATGYTVTALSATDFTYQINFIGTPILIGDVCSVTFTANITNADGSLSLTEKSYTNITVVSADEQEARAKAAAIAAAGAQLGAVLSTYCTKDSLFLGFTDAGTRTNNCTTATTASDGCTGVGDDIDVDACTYSATCTLNVVYPASFALSGMTCSTQASPEALKGFTLGSVPYTNVTATTAVNDFGVVVATGSVGISDGAPIFSGLTVSDGTVTQNSVVTIGLTDTAAFTGELSGLFGSAATTSFTAATQVLVVAYTDSDTANVNITVNATPYVFQCSGISGVLSQFLQDSTQTTFTPGTGITCVKQ